MEDGLKLCYKMVSIFLSAEMFRFSFNKSKNVYKIVGVAED